MNVPHIYRPSCSTCCMNWACKFFNQRGVVVRRAYFNKLQMTFEIRVGNRMKIICKRKMVKGSIIVLISDFGTGVGSSVPTTSQNMWGMFTGIKFVAFERMITDTRALINPILNLNRQYPTGQLCVDTKDLVKDRVASTESLSGEF